MQFAKAFAERRTVGQIAAWHDEVIGDRPVESLSDLEGGRLLTFKPIGIDGIQQVDRRLLHDLRQYPDATIEVGF